MANYNLIEFSPNQSLLRHDFEGYKLSSDESPVYSKCLEGGLHVNMDKDSSCYLNTRILSLHNYISNDPFNPNMVFTFNTNGALVTFTFTETKTIEGPYIVWQSTINPPSSESDCGNKFTFPLAVSFPSENLAIVCNGQNSLNILETGNRKDGRTWLNFHEEEIPPAIVCHSVLRNEDLDCEHQKELDVLLLSISSTEDMLKDASYTLNRQTNLLKASFLHVLYWFTYAFDGKSWKRFRERRLIGSAGLEFVSFLPFCKNLLLLSHDKYHFVFDSFHQIKESQQDSNIEEKQAPLFGFLQDKESITIWLNVGEEITKRDINVLVSVNELKVCLKNRTFIEQCFLHPTKSSESAWTLVDGKLEITITKAHAGQDLRWASLFEGGNHGGEEVFDSQLVEEVHQRLAHLASDEWNANPEKDKPAFNPGQLEECDDASEDLIAAIFNGETHQCTHMARLGAVQHLFNALPQDKIYPSFCLRYDVDGILWEIEQDFVPQHVATFHAFGYVKASKTMAKFTKASPNLSYVAVADVNNHIYVFYQSEKFGGELRNRKTGKLSSTIARQKIITLKNHDEIMGIHCTNDAIFILTKTEIFCYILNRDS